MTIKDKNNDFKEEFTEDFYSEATKQSKNSSLNLDKQIEDIKNESIYKIPSSLNSNRFKHTQEALYCSLNTKYNKNTVYLRIRREESKYSYCLGYFDSEVIAEDGFRYLSKFYIHKKPITEEDSQRNKFLGSHAKGKFEFKEELDNITLELMNTKGYEQITHDFKVFEEIAIKKEFEEAEEERIKYFSFSDYPKDIQEEAKKLLENDKLFDSLLYTIGITHNGDTTLKEQLILVFGSVFVGYPVNTEIGGDTGKGKSDLVYTTSENYPKRYIQHYRTFSSKNLYYDKDSLDKDYNILLFDDVDLSKEDNVETIKTITDNREKVKELRTVGKGSNGGNEAKTYTLDGKFLSILSYAKSNHDEELSNRLFKGFIDNKKDKTEVNNTIKKNVITEIDKNTHLKRLNLINQCCIQYLIEESFTVFNPFNILFNPKDFNNRDVSSFLNLVDTVSFYHKNKRRSISFNDKKVVIGNFKDYKFVYDRWNNDIQKFKLSNNQEKILELLEPFDSEEDFLEYVESKREEYRDIDSSKAKTSFKNGLNTLSTLSKKIGISNRTLKTDIDYSQEKGNKKNLLELGLIYREPLDSSEYKSPYIYGKVKGMASNSSKTMDIMDISEIYPSFNNLELKISFLIYFINRYNILISYKRKKYISSFCSEYSESIENYESLCSFLQSFMDSITEWETSENPSYEDIKIHFDILKESENFLMKYLNKNISINENQKKSLKSESDKKQWIYQEKSNHIHNEKAKEDDSEEIDNKIDIDTEISELIQVNLEYYKELTKQEIIDKFELDPSSEEYDYTILKIENTLNGLLKSNIIRTDSKGFKQVYKLRRV